MWLVIYIAKRNEWQHRFVTHKSLLMYTLWQPNVILVSRYVFISKTVSNKALCLSLLITNRIAKIQNNIRATNKHKTSCKNLYSSTLFHRVFVLHVHLLSDYLFTSAWWDTNGENQSNCQGQCQAIATQADSDCAMRITRVPIAHPRSLAHVTLLDIDKQGECSRPLPEVIAVWGGYTRVSTSLAVRAK